MKQRMHDVEYKEDGIQKRCLNVEAAVQNCYAEQKEYKKRTNGVIEKQIEAIKQYTMTTNQLLTENREKIQNSIQKCEEAINIALEQRGKLDFVSIETKKIDEQLSMLTQRTTYLASQKMDQSSFDDYKRHTDVSIKQNDRTVERIKNDTKSCANYLEKYIPLYIQRLMTEFLEYVFPDSPTRWRINWYNEIKIPMFTAAVLADTGVQSLEERIDQLHEMVTKHILPNLPEDQKVRTPEEEFVFTAMRNRVMHANAKLIIMQLIGQIQNPAKRVSKSKAKVDLAIVTVNQLYGEMQRILSEENPDFAIKNPYEGAGAQDQFDKDQKELKEQMEKDLETDMSVQARVEREVKKRILMSSDAFELKLRAVQEQNIEMLKRLQKVADQELNDRCQTIQGYIQEVHKFQIDEMENFKQCHSMYLNSAQQFDRKIALVFDIEKNYQQMLTQVKGLNKIVNELSNVNLLLLNGKQPKITAEDYKAYIQTPLDGPCQHIGDNGIFSDLPKNIDSLGKNRERLMVLETAGTSSVTTGQAQIIQDDIMIKLRARSGSQIGQRDGPMSGTINNEIVTTGSKPGGQDFATFRPKTQMHLRQRNNRISTQFATIHSNQSQKQDFTIRDFVPKNSYQVARKQSQHLVSPPNDKSLIGIGGERLTENQQNNFNDEVRSVFKKVKQDTQKNVNQINNLILDFRVQNTGVSKKNQTKPVMPTTDSFRHQIQILTKRVGDTSIPQRLEMNLLQDVGKRSTVHTFEAIKPKQIDLGPIHKMNLGVRREELDVDGNKFLRQPDTNGSMFKEPRSIDGKIDNFNRAAGLEHQSNKHVTEIIFDKKAVIQSVKNFM